MSIRKIKANTAEIEGDYVKVETYSKRLTTFLKTFLVLSLICFITFFALPTINLLVAIVSTLGVSILAAALAPGRVLRDIPLVDLVEIKRYQGKNKVTVVLDDERAKRNQQNKKI